MATVIDSHPHHNQNEGIEFPGVYVEPEFISQSEENALMEGIDSLRWDISQSGRRKQVTNPRGKSQTIYSFAFPFSPRITDQKRISKK